MPDLFADLEPLDIGIVIELSMGCGAGVGVNGGIDMVFDLYDFEANTFAFRHVGASLGGSASVSIGIVSGWSTYRIQTVDNFKGTFVSLGVGIGPVSVQGGLAQPSNTGGQLWSVSLGAGVSLGARINGKALEAALRGLSFMTTGGGGKAFNSDDFNLPSTKQVFHGVGQYPRYEDAWKFAFFIQRSCPTVECSLLVAPMQAIALYNGLAWDAKRKREERHARKP